MIHASRHLFFVIMMYLIMSGETTVEKDLESVFLRFYTGKTPDEYIDYSLDNVNTLRAKIIDDRPTVLYIHGFSENLEKKSVQTVTQAYLKRNDHNVIALSYAQLVNKLYAQAVAKIKLVGTAVAAAFDEMVKLGLDPEKLHIVGHSLGSQLAGHISRKVSFRLPRITGLDPAGPLFNNLEAHLSSSDARFVDIIHTDFGFYGIARNTGTIDFYPNGGRRIQPGCPRQKFNIFSEEDFCSHHYSWTFYAESLINESAFLGVQCSSLHRFSSGECDNNTQVIMGYATPSNTNGSVYLVTDSESPFGLAEKGAQSIAMN